MDSGAGDWTGDVTVGTKTLNPTSGDYPETGLGGGAVGLVPYGAHFFESDPPYTSSGPGAIDVPGTLITDARIAITHYGIIGVTGTGKPYIVYEAPGSHCTSGCSAELFSIKTSEWSTISIGAAGSPRDMVLEGTARDGKHYHVDVNGTLDCSDVFGDPGTDSKPYGFIFNTN